MSSLIENNYQVYHQEQVTAYHQATDPIKITVLESFITKLELLEQLDVVETGIKKSSKLRPTKSTTKKLGLVEELKRRVGASTDDIRIPFNLQSSPPIRTSCRGILCVNQHPDQVVRLDRQLTEALAFLSAQEDNFISEDASSAFMMDTTSSGSTIDTTSSGSTIDTTPSESSLAETRSLLPHDSVTVVSKNSVQPTENEPINIFITAEENKPHPDPIEAPEIMTLTVSTLKTRGILMKHTDCTSDDAKRKRRRSTRTVRFCDQSSVRIIKAEPTLEDKLTQARRLINAARNSRENLTGC